MYACRKVEPQLISDSYTGLLEQHRALQAQFPTPLQRLDELHRQHKVSILSNLRSLDKLVRMLSPSMPNQSGVLFLQSRNLGVYEVLSSTICQKLHAKI